jgi:hypothetical protein
VETEEGLVAWAQPDLQDFWWEWTPGKRAKFWRVQQAGQTWILTVEPDGWLTQLQAAVLLGVETVRVHEWVQAKRIESDVAPDGVVVVSLQSVVNIWKHRNAGGRGPGFPRGAFR